MRRLLIIDYISPSGHENFDQIHINALLKLGYSVTLIGKKGFFDKLPSHPNLEIIDLPAWFSKPVNIFSSLFVRLKGMLALIYIMVKYRSSYDYSILLCYDILSSFIYRSRVKTILINHNNLDQLSNNLKYRLTEKYNNCIHVCLNTQMQEYLNHLFPQKDIRYIPHGIMHEFQQISRPKFIKNYDNIIFCPVNRNFNEDFVSSIFNDEIFIRFLKQNNILFVVKRIKGLKITCDNIVSIEQKISYEHYAYLIKESIAVILPYTDEFKYRCSGIFFECVANNTTVLAIDNPSMSIYKNDTDMYLFNNAQKLIEVLACRIKRGKQSINKQLFDPTPYWKDIIE